MSPPLPPRDQLPSDAELRRGGLAVGLLVALVIVVAVLPAEAGIDPTGIGERLGLTAMGRPAPETPAPPPAAVEAPQTWAFRSDETSVTLAAGEGTEVKATMRAGDQLAWSWRTDGGEVHHEFHGEPAGAPPDVYTSYEIGTAAASEGEFEAPFEGVHGWYWKNDTAATVVVTVKTTGVYGRIARVH